MKLPEWGVIGALSYVLWVNVLVPLSQDWNRGWNGMVQTVAEIGK